MKNTGRDDIRDISIIGDNMKTVRVVAAVIKAVNENGETIIFATARGYGKFKGGWEFPGGKVYAVTVF